MAVAGVILMSALDFSLATGPSSMAVIAEAVRRTAQQ
jgi:hypothetical protein